MKSERVAKAQAVLDAAIKELIEAADEAHLAHDLDPEEREMSDRLQRSGFVTHYAVAVARTSFEGEEPLDSVQTYVGDDMMPMWVAKGLFREAIEELGD